MDSIYLNLLYHHPLASNITNIHLAIENNSGYIEYRFLPLDLQQPPVVLPETLDFVVLEPDYPDRKVNSKYINHQSKLQ